MLMLNLTAIESLNEIAINGVVIAHLNDADAQRILDIVRAYASGTTVSTPVSKPVAKAPQRELHMPEEATTSVEKPVGKPVWQEDFLTVTCTDDKQYRLYVTCPVGGEKGKKIRYAIKASAKEHGAKFAGNYDTKEIFWAFPTKKSADEFIKARKAYNKQ